MARRVRGPRDARFKNATRTARRAETSVQCVGTTRSGSRCRNKIAYNPRNPGPWKSKLCGRCSGEFVSETARAMSGLSLDIDAKGFAAVKEQLASGAITQNEAITAALETMTTDGLKRQHDEDKTWFQDQFSPLVALESDIENLLEVAPPGGDDSAAVEHAHMVAFRRFGTKSRGGSDADIHHTTRTAVSPALLRVAESARSVRVLNTASSESYSNQAMRRAVIKRLGEIAASGAEQSDRAMDGLRDHANRAAMSDDASELAHVYGSLDDARQAERLSQNLHAQMVKWPLSFQPERYPRLIGSSRTTPFVKPEIAQMMADHNVAQAADAAEWAQTPVRVPVQSGSPRRCARKTTAGHQCKNTWTEGMDKDWCGRCAGLPASWTESSDDLGLPGGYIALSDPLKEGRRLADHLESVAEAARSAESGQRWVPEETVSFEDPKQFTRDCESLRRFANKDIYRTGLDYVYSQEWEGGNVLVATDSYRAGMVFGGEGAKIPSGTSLPAEMVLSAKKSKVSIAGIEKSDYRAKFALTGDGADTPADMYLPKTQRQVPDPFSRIIDPFRAEVASIDPETGDLGDPAPGGQGVIAEIGADDLYKNLQTIIKMKPVTDYDPHDPYDPNAPKEYEPASNYEVAVLAIDAETGEAAIEPFAENPAIREECRQQAAFIHDNQDDPGEWPSRRLVAVNAKYLRDVVMSGREHGARGKGASIKIAAGEPTDPVYLDTNTRFKSLLMPRRVL